MALYTDIRPTTLDEMVGNRSTISSIKSLFEDGPEKAPRAYLIFGPSGAGKTTTARIIKSMVGCDDIDFIEMNAADSRGIDTIRELTQNAEIRPMMSKFKVILLDEMHMLTTPAQNCLLKSIEDGPKHVFWILCTTDLSGVIKTIQNRCSMFAMSLLRPAEMEGLIDRAAHHLVEGGIESDLVKLIADASGGSPRKALVILEKVAFVSSAKEAKELIANEPGVDGNESPSLLEFLKAVTQGKNVRTILDLFFSLDEEPEKIRIALINFMGSRLRTSQDRESSLALSSLIHRFDGPPLFGPTAKSVMAARLYDAVAK